MSWERIFGTLFGGFAVKAAAIGLALWMALTVASYVGDTMAKAGQAMGGQAIASPAPIMD